MNKYIIIFFFVIVFSSIGFALTEGPSGRYLIVIKSGTSYEYPEIFRIDTMTGKTWTLKRNQPYSDDEFVAKFGQEKLNEAKGLTKMFAHGYIMKEDYWEEISEKPETYSIGPYTNPLK